MQIIAINSSWLGHSVYAAAPSVNFLNKRLTYTDFFYYDYDFSLEVSLIPSFYSWVSHFTHLFFLTTITHDSLSVIVSFLIPILLFGSNWKKWKPITFCHVNNALSTDNPNKKVPLYFIFVEFLKQFRLSSFLVGVFLRCSSTILEKMV